MLLRLDVLGRRVLTGAEWVAQDWRDKLGLGKRKRYVQNFGERHRPNSVWSLSLIWACLMES